MGVNTFGLRYCFTTWGESHGPAMGVVIDGVPSGVRIDFDEIKTELARRRPGVAEYTSERSEIDVV